MYKFSFASYVFGAEQIPKWIWEFTWEFEWIFFHFAVATTARVCVRWMAAFPSGPTAPSEGEIITHEDEMKSARNEIKCSGEAICVGPGMCAAACEMLFHNEEVPEAHRQFLSRPFILFRCVYGTFLHINSAKSMYRAADGVENTENWNKFPTCLLISGERVEKEPNVQNITGYSAESRRPVSCSLPPARSAPTPQLVHLHKLTTFFFIYIFFFLLYFYLFVNKQSSKSTFYLQ